ncbi:LppA family lipoprotein [Streptomyces sp. NPDC045431]|uniref:LppA family lipoprotein n=1 Tax=Streptomyces sp. NPDC045431 TaxID=3155613 RepID=UPI0033E556BA
MSRISLQEAAEKAASIMLDSVSAVNPELNWVHYAPTQGGCGGYTIDGKATSSVTRRVAVMTIVSEARRGSLLGVVERHWKQRGYKITEVNPDKDLPAISASTPEDFRLGVTVGKKGQFFFSITTPCFIESEVQPPKTKPNGTPLDGEHVPDPYVRSDFWPSNTSAPSSPSAP